ncbi:MAG: sulfatase-like hydrolase/transferase [Chitinophagales bacterium]|nr:sulfatase-like hydrolase/transferase [Chitinophagales bacterium]
MPGPRNIILLVVDSLRYDVAMKQGLRMPYTQANAIQFSGARSAGCWTLPATTSLFTGKMPHEHGATSQTRGFRPELPTLAERLKAAGYNTYQCTANIATTNIFGLDRGFDQVHRIYEHVTPKFRKLLNIALMLGKPRVRKLVLSRDFMFQRLAEDFRMGIAWAQNTYPDTFDFARRTIAENEAKGERTFMFLNLMEAHFPYHVAPTFKLTAEGLLDKVRESMGLFHTLNQTFLKKGYSPVKPRIEALLKGRQEKSWNLLCNPLDEFIREMHQDKNNLVVFCSDHGDNFGEQDWVYHFSNVNDSGNRVPLLWLDHEHQKVGEKNHLVSSRYIYHDILRAAGVAVEGDSLFSESPTNLPMLQSYWYNNDNKTLPQYRYNQLCFIQGQDRFVYRDDVNRHYRWLHAKVAEGLGQTEPHFQAVEAGFNPIEEVVADAQRKAYLQQAFSEFKQFSDSIRK